MPCTCRIWHEALVKCQDSCLIYMGYLFSLVMCYGIPLDVHTALPPVPVNNLRPARIRPRLYNPNPNNVPHPVLPHAMALSRCSRRPFTTPCSVRGRSRGYHDEIFGFRKSREYVFPDCALPLFAGALICLLITLSCMHRYPCPIGEPRRQRIVTALC